MTSGRFTHWAVRRFDWLSGHILKPPDAPAHQITGRRGEEEAYFYLRRLGYVIVARNFRSPNHRGEIDLIGWDGNVLCFIEVKTRTTRTVKPAEAAVDHEKLNDLARVGRDYLRHLEQPCSWRFDVVSVYLEASVPTFELFQNVPFQA
jgi:putative endonuclease